MATLVLLRHGESVWNAADIFTGWIDVRLSDRGQQQARQAGQLVADGEHLPDVVHTSVQTRAIQTADLALSACGRSWVPVRRSWRLNSNHYGEPDDDPRYATLPRNTLRALIKHLEAVSDDAVSGLEVPNAKPLYYEFPGPLSR